MNKCFVVALTLRNFPIRFFFLGLILMLAGCAPKVVTKAEYRTVEMPVKCAVLIPEKPSPTDDVIDMNLLILKYTEELRAALEVCR